MDLNFNQADIDFRNEVRDFIKTSYTSEMKAELRRSKNGSAKWTMIRFPNAARVSLWY